MVKVITYGTYDMLHRGHIRLLERAKALGDYLIVGVTSDDFDRSRGKINVQQSLPERLEAVRATSIADEVIVEEYAGQKIDDIRRYGVDVFTVGSDWKGHFDYLEKWCKVVYLDRTEGISSTDLRTAANKLRLGLVGDVSYIYKVLEQSRYVNGIEVVGVRTRDADALPQQMRELPCVTEDLGELLGQVDAVAVVANPSEHYGIIEQALAAGKHVLCESPLVLSRGEYVELRSRAQDNECLLVDAMKTAYSMAYSRLLLLVQSGRIGRVVSVDATCTSLRPADFSDRAAMERNQNSMCEWGPTGMLPVFQILGTGFTEKRIITLFADEASCYDSFTKIDFAYPGATASVKVGKGAKSEGSLVVTGTEGYAYVPAPWWKTDYFELRFEDQSRNRRYFYQLDGEGIRYELVTFLRSIMSGGSGSYIEPAVSEAIVGVMEDFHAGTDVRVIR